MPRGAISALVADVASLNVTGALGALFHRGERSDIRCGVADFDAQHGVLATRAVLLDTDKGLIGASGDVHLDSETVALTVGGQPAHRGLSLPSALAISGTLSHPKVALTRRDASARADPGDALRASPNPLDSALRYVDQRLAADPGCAALLAQAPRQGAFGSGGDPLRQ